MRIAGTHARYLRAGVIVTGLMIFVVLPFLIYGEGLERWTTHVVNGDAGRAAVAWTGAALLASDVLLPIPASIVSTALGVFLGVAMGTAVGTAGMTAGCVLGYAMGRFVRAALVRKLVPAGDLEDAMRWLARSGPIVLVLCRAVPVLAEASGIAAGMAQERFVRMFAATTLANLGISYTYASIGAAAGGTERFLLAFCLSLAVPGIALGIVTAIRRWRRAGGP